MKTNLLSLLILFLMSACGVAQFEWKIVEGEERFQKVLSYKFDGRLRGLHMEPEENTLVAAVELAEARMHIAALDFETLKLRSLTPLPVGWDWQNAAFGTRYACSANGTKLTLVDLFAGEVVGTAEVSNAKQCKLIFDQALVFGEEVFEIPSLKRMKDHPLAAALRLQSPMEVDLVAPLWRRDQDTWVVKGLQFGRDLKPKQLYLGRGNLLGVKAREFEKNISKYKLDLDEVVGPVYGLEGKFESDKIRVESSDPALKIDGGIDFQACSKGFVGQSRKHIMVLYSAQDAGRFSPSGWWQEADFVAAPVWAADGKTISIDHERAESPFPNITEVRIGQKSKSIEGVLNGKTLEVSKGSSFIRDELFTTSGLLDTASKIREQAKVKPSATTDEIIQGYVSANGCWIDQVEKSLGVEFQGVPFEFDATLGFSEFNEDHSQCNSLIVDIPNELLIEILARRKVATPAEIEQNDVGGRLAYLDQLLASNPAIVVKDTPTGNKNAGKFEFVVPSHSSLLKLLPIRILLDGLLLLLLVGLADRGFKVGFRFNGNPLLTAFLIAGAVGFFDTAFLFTVDYFTESLAAENGLLLLVRALVKATALGVITFVIFRQGINGDWKALICLSIVLLIVKVPVAVGMVVLVSLFLF